MKPERAALVIPWDTMPWAAHRRATDSVGANGVACSTCGEFIAVVANDHPGPLLELECRRCATSDVYHQNALQQLPASPPPNKPVKAG